MRTTRRHALVGLSSALVTSLHTIQALSEQCTSTRTLADCETAYGSLTCVSPPRDIGSAFNARPPAKMKLPESFSSKLLPASSIAGFDEALRAAVLSPLNRLLGINPIFGYYDEHKLGQAPNAVASPEADAQGRNGTILLGLALLRNMIAQVDGDYAVMAICAHEYGHILQYEHGAQKYIASHFPCYCIELHADFVAGFFLRRVQSRVGKPNFQAVGRTWSGWSKESCTHGSRTQRVDALETGFFFGDPYRDRPVSRVVEFGIDYIRKYA